MPSLFAVVRRFVLVAARRRRERQAQNVPRGTFWPACILLLTLTAGAAPAQTLAHRNWAGSGMTPDPWWRGAEFYRIDPISFQDSNGDGFGDLRGLTDRLDYLQILGVDALVLAPFPVHPGLAPLEPVYGNDDDLARLLAEATRRRLRLLAELPLAATRSTPETLAAARFLLSRGFAGLLLTSGPADAPTANQRAELLREISRLKATYPGQRILIAGEASSAAQAFPVSRAVGRRHIAIPAVAELTLATGMASTSNLTAATVRVALARGARGFASDSASANVTDTTQTLRSFSRIGAAQAKAVAALLLTQQGDPLLLFGQELGMAGSGASFSPAPMQWGGQPGFTAGTPWLEPGPNDATNNVTLEDADAGSLLAWYRRLGELRHAYPALRTGSQEVLETSNPDVVAWLRQAKTGEATVTVLNLSARPAVVALQRVGELHALATSYVLAATTKGNVLSLPSYGAYVGEVRRAGGLERLTVPFYVRHRQ